MDVSNASPSGEGRQEVVLVHNTHAHSDGNTKPFLDVQAWAHVEEDGPREERKNYIDRARPALMQMLCQC